MPSANDVSRNQEPPNDSSVPSSAADVTMSALTGADFNDSSDSNSADQSSTHPAGETASSSPHSNHNLENLTDPSPCTSSETSAESNPTTNSSTESLSPSLLQKLIKESISTPPNTTLEPSISLPDGTTSTQIDASSNVSSQTDNEVSPHSQSDNVDITPGNASHDASSIISSGTKNKRSVSEMDFSPRPQSNASAGVGLFQQSPPATTNADMYYPTGSPTMHNHTDDSSGKYLSLYLLSATDE